MAPFPSHPTMTTWDARSSHGNSIIAEIRDVTAYEGRDGQLSPFPDFSEEHLSDKNTDIHFGQQWIVAFLLCNGFHIG